MNPLRFCLLTTFYPPHNFGGDGIDVQRTARALVRRGHQVTVVHEVDAYEWLAGKRLPPAPVVQDGVEVFALRSRLGVLSPLLTHQLGYPVVHGREISRLIRQRAFDVIVFNNVSLIGGPGLLSFGGPPVAVQPRAVREAHVHDVRVVLRASAADLAPHRRAGAPCGQRGPLHCAQRVQPSEAR
jgi:hypothetical protein